MGQRMKISELYRNVVKIPRENLSSSNLLVESATRCGQESKIDLQLETADEAETVKSTR